MNYLLDTNVISELRKGRRADTNVQIWFKDAPDEGLYLSVLVIGELRTGVERRRRRDPETAQVLERWLNGIERDFAERILPIDIATADQWGHLNGGDPLSCVDSLLAATALRHDLTLVTRNTRDIRTTGVKYLNPFKLPSP
jgi:predicted nucleic acid-binding protein